MFPNVAATSLHALQNNTSLGNVHRLPARKLEFTVTSVVLAPAAATLMLQESGRAAQLTVTSALLNNFRSVREKDIVCLTGNGVKIIVHPSVLIELDSNDVHVHVTDHLTNAVRYFSTNLAKDLVYTPLDELHHFLDQKVNVFGIVKDLKAPQQTKSGEFLLQIFLKDESNIQLPTDARCMLFFESFQKLPPIKRQGDIVRLQSVVIRQYNGKIQIQLDKACSTLCRWSNLIGDTLTPDYALGTPAPVVTAADRDRVEELRRLNFASRLQNPSNTTQLCDIRNPFLGSILAEVVRVKTGLPTAVYIRDGTMPPPSFAAQFEEWHVMISVHDEHAADATALVPGMIVRFENVKASSNNLGNHLRIHGDAAAPMRRIFVLTDGDIHARELRDRILRGLPALPLHQPPHDQYSAPARQLAPSSTSNLTAGTSSFTFLSNTTRRDAPLLKISQLLKEAVAGNVYRLHAIALATWPSDIRQFSSLYCRVCVDCSPVCVPRDPPSFGREVYCPECSQEISQFKYMFNVVLGDETGETEVIFYGNDAKLFLGVEPTNFYTDTMSCAALGDQLQKLEADGNHRLHIAVHAYENDGRIRFRVTETTLLQ